MKKQIIISSLIVAALWSLTAVAVFNTASAKESESSGLIANNSTLTTKTPIATSSETVYVMTDENGNAKSKFISSTIYDGNENLPFEFKVSYFLDGQEIAAKDLAGKSGHVKIIFNYASTARYQNRLVPFVAITNLVLDHSKFTNIKLDNGKIVHETPDSYIIAGFSLAGGNSNLGVDFIPETFTLEADVTDFKLENTYTVFDNSIIADLDLSKLTELDSVVNSIYQLSDGLDKIIAGSNELVSGMATALDGTKALYAGSQKIITGFDTLKEYSTELVNGATGIIRNALIGTPDHKGLNLQIQDNAALMAIIQAHEIGFPITTDNYIESIEALESYVPDMTYSLEQTKNLVTFALGTIGYTQGVDKAAAGITDLSNGLGALIEGQTKLYQGSITLRDGLNTFKTSGIDKLVNFAKNDLSRFTNNLRATVRAAASYRNFGNTDAKSVKFVVKTPSI